MSDAQQNQLAYRIVKWNERHSSYEQRRSGGNWITCPTSFDSLGLRRLLSEAQGLKRFGCYMLMAEVAAKCSPPGFLARNTGPLTERDLSTLTGVSARAFGDAIQTLMRPDIAWIDQVPWPSSAELPTDDKPPNLRSDSGQPTDGERAAHASRAHPRPPAGGGAAAAAVCINQQQQQQQHVREVLARIGADVHRLPDLANVTADAVLRQRISIDGKTRDPVAVVIARLQRETPPKVPTITDVAEAIKAGWIKSIDGNTVGGRVTRNKHGVYCDEQLVLAVDAVGEAVFG